MFDQLFGKLSVVVHHRAAPYAAERERFLEHCARQGYAYSGHVDHRFRSKAISDSGMAIRSERSDAECDLFG